MNRITSVARSAEFRMTTSSRPARTGASDQGAQTRRGSIDVIIGCMFSGKTTELLRRVEAFPVEHALTIKHVIDDRYRSDAVVSHNGKARSARSVNSASEIPSLIAGCVDVVAIDEAHFFDESLVAVLQDLARDHISVITTALDRDSWGRPFEIIERLRSVADETTELHSVCARCGKRADRTQRLTPIVDGRMVGGTESYEPRCLGCWTPPSESARILL